MTEYTHTFIDYLRASSPEHHSRYLGIIFINTSYISPPKRVIYLGEVPELLAFGLQATKEDLPSRRWDILRQTEIKGRLKYWAVVPSSSYADWRVYQQH